MVLLKDVRTAVDECKRFIDKVEKWMTGEIEREFEGSEAANPAAPMKRASMNASEALVKIRK